VALTHLRIRLNKLRMTRMGYFMDLLAFIIPFPGKVVRFIANRTCNTTVTMVTVFATRKYGMTQ